MTVKRLFVVLLFVAIFTMAVRETLDPDMWWHLRTGEIALQRGIPKQDIFSFTVPDNSWITHEWLSQIIMWLNYEVAGFNGLMLVFAAITAITFWLVYLTCDGRPYLAGFVVLLAAIASAPVWGVRPQMFNLLFTAIMVFLVERFREGRIRRRTLLLLPLLTALWANLHSAYLLGIAVLITYIAGEGGRLLLGRESARGLDWAGVRWMALITAASFLAAALNPNGVELWIYPFFTLGSNAMQQFIQEWQSPDFHLTIYWPFAAMLALGVIGLLWSKRPPDLTDLLMFGGTAAAGMLSARHIPLFAIVAAPIVARYLLVGLEGTMVYSLITGEPDRRGKPTLIILNWVLIILVAVAAGVWIINKINGNQTAIAKRYPIEAVDYLQQTGLAKQHGYNSYNWGGYLIWRGIPVFVDGRADVYGDDFLYFYRRTFDLTSAWQEPLDEHNVDYVIMEESSPLNTLLAASEQWREAYRDEVAAVFVRAMD